ncbi:TlpA family protein disulfide reductase [Arenibacter sp. 6A1]|uniref:TlpA family protein disulfide reductase n=1 Tax=Arenibacter sp. 6A1 TaxID=2720391 RepID=UPI001446D010|nr:TlpA disulfide reductase family protein [Arenibacter sp. 6A1]NKI25401.1 TlpA family protein disulfide reductase [Arenibacter sp. 6A1]
MVFKYFFFIASLFLAINVEAQHNISGTLSPASHFKWIIAYQLQPGSLNYTANTPVEEGSFSLTMPQTAPAGIYRLVYAVPQEEFYFDVIYNGREDITLNFDFNKGISFSNSQENILYHDYFSKISEVEQDIIKYYSERNSNKDVLSKLNKKLFALQNYYEAQTSGLFIEPFIKANHPYISDGNESVSSYVRNKNRQFFDHFSFENPVLQASKFISEKINNYVFTALPLERLSADKLEKEMQVNVEDVVTKIKGTSLAFKIKVLSELWREMVKNNHNATADYIYNNHLKEMAITTNNGELINEIEAYNRLRIGAVAPEITWVDGYTEKKLSDLKGADHYVLVFWSSSCPHCLEQLPLLQQAMKNRKNTKVVAIGLEDDAVNWKKEIALLPTFIHGISLGKWESPYTSLYQIELTPTFYILDDKKRIVAKPADLIEVKEVLNSLL